MELQTQLTKVSYFRIKILYNYLKQLKCKFYNINNHENQPNRTPEIVVQNLKKKCIIILSCLQICSNLPASH